jgi:hypothetical protein
MMNPYKFQVVEWYRSWPDGTSNRIVASAATLKGCLNQYRKHIDTFRLANTDHKPIKTSFRCDGVSFDVTL